MEQQSSVLLYSKYSRLSTQLLDTIQTSNVNLSKVVSLQTLCIDNEKIRQRIHQNKQIDITTVPCILVIFPDGGIEKYDGEHSFQWIEQIIQKFTPPPPPIPPQPQKIPPKSIQQLQQEQQIKQRITLKNNKKSVEANRDRERENQKKKYEKHLNKSNNKSVKNRRKLVDITEEELDNESHTNIDDLDSDSESKSESESENNDRHRQRKPVGAIREDSGNYIRNDELFPGEQPDVRQAKTNALKKPIHASEKKTLDLMTKAKEMEKGRQETPLRPGHSQRQ